MEVFCGVIGFPLLLVVLIILESRRVTIYEMERIPEIQREVEAEEMAQVIADVNTELAARDAAPPRVLAFDARGKLAEYERRLVNGNEL